MWFQLLPKDILFWTLQYPHLNLSLLVFKAYDPGSDIFWLYFWVKSTDLNPIFLCACVCLSLLDQTTVSEILRKEVKFRSLHAWIFISPSRFRYSTRQNHFFQTLRDIVFQHPMLHMASYSAHLFLIFW